MRFLTAGLGEDERIFIQVPVRQPQMWLSARDNWFSATVETCRIHSKDVIESDYSCSVVTHSHQVTHVCRARAAMDERSTNLDWVELFGSNPNLDGLINMQGSPVGSDNSALALQERYDDQRSVDLVSQSNPPISTPTGAARPVGDKEKDSTANPVAQYKVILEVAVNTREQRTFTVEGPVSRSKKSNRLFIYDLRHILFFITSRRGKTGLRYPYRNRREWSFQIYRRSSKDGGVQCRGCKLLVRVYRSCSTVDRKR